MTECTLGESKITGPLVDPGGKRMTERVNGIPLGNPSCFQPEGKTKLHLSCANPLSSHGKEKGIGGSSGMVFEMGFEQPLQLTAQEHHLLGSVFPSDSESAMCDVGVSNVQGHERSKPDPGSKQELKHEGISLRNRRFSFFKCSEQHLNFSVGHDSWRSSRISRHANKSGRILSQISAINQEPKKAPEDRFRAVQGYHGFGADVDFVGKGFRCKESSEISSSNLGYMDVATYPFFERSKVPQVDSQGKRTLSVGLELLLKSVYGSRKSHGRHQAHERFGRGINQLYSAKSPDQGVIREHPGESAKYRPISSPHLPTVALFEEIRDECTQFPN